MHSSNTWKWDGESVYQILEQGSMPADLGEEVQKWRGAIAADLREPVCSVEMVAGKRREYELASVLAVDVRNLALLRMWGVGGWKYTVLPVTAAREFLGKCRKQFNQNKGV